MRLAVSALLVAAAAAQTEGDSTYADSNSYADNSCSAGCPDEWVNDGMCDVTCNVEACKFDGSDCFHDASECWAEEDGRDYRGKVATTKSGRACQVWAEQIPWHHTKTTVNFPSSGLGGHNYCRNPDGEAGPYCFTLDYPEMRWELCDVGTRSATCDGAGVAARAEASALAIAQDVTGHVKELELSWFDVALPPSLAGIKIVLVPINGDADLFVSFSKPQPDRNTATWVEENVGVKQFLLPRSSIDYCPAPATAASAGGCMLHLAVSGFEEGDFKLVVYNYTAGTAPGGTAAAQWSCSPGCDETRLGNTQCDVACNTSACIWDQGDCGYTGEFAMEELCAVGCPVAWIDDGYCDEACYNAECRWDAQDCANSAAGCADGCLPSWIDDAECDEVCNNEACGYDGMDCDASTGECYSDARGTDYRGSVSTSKSGLACQIWSRQSPQQHTKTNLNFPDEGLGGHNHCRNPGNEEAGPWCYTMDPSVRFEQCEVPPPQPSCSGRTQGADEGIWEHYKALCPVDCAGMLGNGQCETRCNISSCAFDRGDCGVGLSVAAVLGGYAPQRSASEFTLMGVGVSAGVLIGLLILRMVLAKKKSQELKLRGYTMEERVGMDGAPDDI